MRRSRFFSHHINHGKLVHEHFAIRLVIDKLQRGAATPDVITISGPIAIETNASPCLSQPPAGHHWDWILQQLCLTTLL